MLESKVEAYLVRRVKKLGGLCPKWVSPGFSGVPDRIVFLPGGRIIFVETKKPGEDARKLQKKVHEKLQKLGCDVRVIDTIDKVDAFIEEIRQ